MKKLLGILVLGLLWCNISFANILLIECKYTWPPGYVNERDGKIWKDGKIHELDEGERDELFINFEKGYIQRTRVYSDFRLSLNEKMQEEGFEFMTPNKVDNIIFRIDFADKKEIIGTRIKEFKNPIYNYTEEITINLNTNVASINIYGDTAESINMVKLHKSNVNYPLLRTCEREDASDSVGGSSGTAFFINNKGHLLTNNHVIEGCALPKISYKNKDYETKLIATDKILDLALLKAEIKPKVFYNFSKDEAKKLSKVYVAGYPLGKGLSDDLKISSGIVSSLKGFEDNSNEIQIDAPINPGNSGGPIINENGDLVAIAVSGLAKDLTEGINFGIKASAAENFLKSNKINPKKSMYSGIKDNDKLLKILEEGTVYTFCN